MDVHVTETIFTLLSITFPILQPDFTSNLNQRSFDYIIVGAGSAGATLASRLTENSDVSVLLLDAGTYPPFQSEIPGATSSLQLSPVDWQYKTTSQSQSFLAYTNKQSNYPRGKVLGGTSTINGMVYLRGNPKDYEQWTNSGIKGWNWSNVLPYFLKAEGNTIPSQENNMDFHNTTGPLTVSEAKFKTQSLNFFLTSAVENGYPIRDLNAYFKPGVMQNPFTMRDGARCGTYDAYLQPALERKNLVIGTESLVTKIVFDSNKRAKGVVFNHFNKTYQVNATKEIIISAGTINSPQILLLSGIGPKSQLQKYNIPVVADLPGVGQNLQDHVVNGALIWTMPDSKVLFNTQSSTIRQNWQDWFFKRTGPLTSPLASEAVALVSDKSQGDDWPSVEILYASSSYASGGEGTKMRLGLTQEFYDKYLKPIANQSSFGIRPFVLRPQSRGWVQLQSSNPMQNPLINFNFFSDPDDLKTCIEGTKIAFKLGNSSHFQGAKFIPTIVPGCEMYKLFSDQYWNCTCRYFTVTGNHAVGTCKMGVKNDTSAVVDSELMVYKTSGLRVIDASIMPFIVSGNINAAVVMIAEKLSDVIKKSETQ